MGDHRHNPLALATARGDAADVRRLRREMGLAAAKTGPEYQFQGTIQTHVVPKPEVLAAIERARAEHAASGDPSPFAPKLTSDQLDVVLSLDLITAKPSMLTDEVEGSLKEVMPIARFDYNALVAEHEKKAAEHKAQKPE